MDNNKGLFTAIRTCLRIVPWRMRSKLIAILLGSVGVALMDMASVALMLPVMELVSGQSVQSSVYLQIVANIVGTEEVQTMLVFTLGVVIALMITKNILSAVFRWWSLGVMAEAQSAVVHEVFALYLSASYESHRKRDTSDIYQTLNVYIPGSFGIVMLGFIQLFVDGLSALLIVVALAAVSPMATLLALLVFGGTAFLMQALLRKRTIRIGIDMRDVGLAGWRYLSPAVEGFTQVRLAEMENDFVTGYSKSRREGNMLGRKSTMLAELPKYVLEVTMILGIALIAVVLFATSDEQTAVAVLGVFAVASVRIIPTLNRALASATGIRAAQANAFGLAEQIDLLETEPGRYRPNTDQATFGFGDIDVSRLSFRFADGERSVLDEVSVKLPEGATIALVGSSGAGKTTFVDILLGLLTPTGGSVEVDGKSIHSDPYAWRRQLGVVTQDVYLLDASIRENIAFETEASRIDPERLTKAVEMAQLTDFIAALPDGIETVVGYQGARISGGQKQRIGIARALYREPKLLILDEATSALDNETEAKITRTIDALRGKMTIVVVAHRLSTVRNADEILFFSEGKIASRGTMAELVERNDEFRSLVELGRLS